MLKNIKINFQIFIIERIYKSLKFFMVNVKKHPEYLSKDGKFCHRNYLVANMIDDLQKIEINIRDESEND